MNEPNKLLTQREAVDWMRERGIGRDAFLSALHEGQIGSVPIGKREYYPESELIRATTPQKKPTKPQ